MHYFKKNIGDYAKKTGRLSMLQHGAYTLLIDSCYDRERFPTLDEAIEWTWASSKEEIEAVEFILKRFFTFEDGVYTQTRIKEEIADYHKNAETNKRIALEREAKRKQNDTKRERIVNEASPTVNEPPPNHKPLTKNQEPLTNKKHIAPPEGVAESVWQDFLKVRRTKKAVVTELAIAGIKREADKAKLSLQAALTLCCENNWAGFKADWVKDLPAAVDKKPFIQSSDGSWRRYNPQTNSYNDCHIDLVPSELRGVA